MTEVGGGAVKTIAFRNQTLASTGAVDVSEGRLSSRVEKESLLEVGVEAGTDQN